MTRNNTLSRIVRFFRAGYPETVPVHHYLPALALLPRRLSEDEVDLIAAGLTQEVPRPVPAIDVRVEITKCLDALPSAQDVERVARRLRAAGRNVPDQFEAPG